jgi:isoquinoline 1-oxidoreductase subunit beta
MTSLQEDARDAEQISRRHFLVAGAGGLTLGVMIPAIPGVRGVLAGASPAAAATAGGASVNAYVHIGTDNSVTLTYGGCEFGQGSMTGLAQILAEELRVPWRAINVTQSLADPTVSYITGGSTAIRQQFAPVATAGAAAREMLITAGAQTLNVSRSACAATNGAVVATVNGTTKSMPYGRIAALAATMPVPANPPLTDPSAYKVIGQSIPRLDVPSKVNGRAKYGLDVRIPGMVFAAIKHAPAFGATLARTPPVPAGAIGVVPIVAAESRGAITKGDTNAVAVVASNTWAAFQGSRQLGAAWNIPASASQLSSAAIRAQANALMTNGNAMLGETPSGDVDAALAAATSKIDSTYFLPYLPHVCMEVLNCTVDYRGASCEIWVPTQAATFVTATAQQLTGLAPSAIKVHTTLLGGGLGRKFEQDFVAAAIQVAMKIRKPVMLVYPREEDFTNDQYRPMALVNVKAALSGRSIPAWKYRNVSSSILDQHGFLTPGQPDSQATDGATALPYAFGSSRLEWVPLPAGIPVGFWRSVGHSINAFAVESAIDELAALAHVDPFVFRKGLLTGNARANAVLDAADALTAWRHKLPAGHGWGVAYSEGFGSIVCQVAEISAVTASSLTVNRVACVVDCGRAINPKAVEMQMQGGIVHGLNAALWGAMNFVAGAAQTRNFDNYRVLSLPEMPHIDVKIVNSGAALGGIGEPGVPPIAPALANAYFNVTRKRVRTLPFFPGQGMPGD